MADRSTIADYGSQEAAMQRYFREGHERAMVLGNRGPIRFDDDGKLDRAIVEAYERCGFYIFEGVIAPAELAELEAAYLDMLDRVPVTPDSKVDRHGRPALGADLDTPITYWAKPLGDPFGGTDRAQGRHSKAVIAFTIGLIDQAGAVAPFGAQFSPIALQEASYPELGRRLFATQEAARTRGEGQQ